MTDPGKASKKGRMTLKRSNLTGEYMTLPFDEFKPYDGEWEDVMKIVYRNGVVMNRITLDEVRKNTGLW